MIPKPNEKMIINKEAIIATIIRANRERGSPKMIAFLRMSRYTSKRFITLQFQLNR